MTAVTTRLTREFIATLPAQIKIADIGGATSSLAYADLATADIYDISTGHDICAAPLPEPYGAIICADVLEHVFDPVRAADNICSSLGWGGHLFVTTLFIWPIHRFPVDTYRYTEDSLRYLFRSLRIHSCGYSHDPGEHRGIGLTRVSLHGTNDL